jgi:hypothetical protein
VAPFLASFVSIRCALLNKGEADGLRSRARKGVKFAANGLLAYLLCLIIYVLTICCLITMYFLQLA